MRRKTKKYPLIVLGFIPLMHGCAGSLQCEWVSQDEKFAEIVETTIEVIRDETIKNDTKSQ